MLKMNKETNRHAERLTPTPTPAHLGPERLHICQAFVSVHLVQKVKERQTHCHLHRHTNMHLENTQQSYTPPLVLRASALCVCSVRVMVPFQADHCSLKQMDAEQPEALKLSLSLYSENHRK